MAEDFDVEALLEAPYQKETSQQNGSKDERRRHSSSDDDDDRKRRRTKQSHSHSRTHRSRQSDSRDRGRDQRYRRRQSPSSSRSNRRRSRSPSRSPKRRRSRSQERGGHSHSMEKKQQRSVTPEREENVQVPEDPITAEERDQRTVFCMQLARNIRPRDLEEFFCKVGQVNDVRIISDRNSRRSKGIAYIEFTDKSSVPLAMNLSGQKLLGAPLMVMPTQAEKNRAAAEAEKLKQPQGPTRLYVGSLHFNITEPMIKAIFEPFGPVDSVQMIYDTETGRSKGYGFVQFKDPDCAKQAMDQLNGFELAGRPMKVGPVTERGDSTAYSFLDDEEYEKGGVELNSTARAALMAKLSQGHSAGLIVPGLGAGPTPAVQQALTAALPVPLPTPCFMLTNMFDPTKEKDPEWDMDIRDDVLEECSKYGPIYHLHVDKVSPHGMVYVKSSSPDAATKASQALHGRWFAGKQLVASPVQLSNYHAMFPASITASRPLQQSTA